MKTPVFYAIGHAIVDYLYDEKQTPNANNFELPPPMQPNKGTHVTSSEFDKIIDNIEKNNPNWNHRSQGIRFPGGIAANISRCASILGAKTFFLGTIGYSQGQRDDDAIFFEEKMKEAGVFCNITGSPEKTGRFISIKNPVTSIAASPSAAKKIDLSHIDYTFLDKCDCIITEGMLFQNIGVFNRICELCITYEKPLAIDISTVNYADKMAIALPKLAKQIPLIIFANETEASSLQNCGIDPAALTLSDLYPMYINMRGPKGCSIRVHGTEFSIETQPIPAYDATGAGDTFIGAFLTSFFSVPENKQDIHYIKQCLEYANKVAAQVLDVPLCTLRQDKLKSIKLPSV